MFLLISGIIILITALIDLKSEDTTGLEWLIPPLAIFLFFTNIFIAHAVINNEGTGLSFNRIFQPVRFWSVVIIKFILAAFLIWPALSTWINVFNI